MKGMCEYHTQTEVKHCALANVRAICEALSKFSREVKTIKPKN